MLIEFIRLIVVLAFTALAYRLGREGLAESLPIEVGSRETGAFLVTALGAGIGYIAGGVVARSLDAALKTAESHLAQRHASEVLAATIGLLVGLALAALVVWPLLVVIPNTELSYPLASIVIVLLAGFGYRFALRKRLEVFGVLGVSPLVGPDTGGCLLDASAAIDGRIIALWKAGLLPSPVYVPSFILWELQGIADSSDPTRRRRGRRGLDVLASLREAGAPLKVIDEDPAATTEPDAKLLIVARRRGLPIVTSDANLAKAGELQGLRVLSLHALSELLRPPVLPGERVRITLIKEGREPGQAIGYLDDGTMVVVEQARSHLGGEVETEITSVLQNPTGRMLFGHLTAEDPGDEAGPGRLRTVP